MATTGSDPSITTYRHTQRGPWWLVVFILGVVFLASGWLAPLAPTRIVLWVCGLTMFPLGASLRHLTVEDAGDHLSVAFGPLRVFRKRVWYDDIVQFEKGKTTWLDGWGIHMSLRGGWVWNMWGFDCIVLRLKQGISRVGTDDPDGLLDLLRRRLPDRA